MAIIGLSINWMVGCQNDPAIRIHVDHDEIDTRAGHEACAWVAHSVPEGKTFYIRSLGDRRWSYLLENPRNRNGFGGRIFRLRMVDGTYRDVKGPWSSNTPSAMHITGVDLIGITLIDTRDCYYSACFEVAIVQDAFARFGVQALLEKVDWYDGLHQWRVTTEKPSTPAGFSSFSDPPIIDHWPHKLAGSKASIDVGGAFAMPAAPSSQ